MTNEEFWIRRFAELEDRIERRFKKADELPVIQERFRALQSAVLEAAVKQDDQRHLVR